MSALSLRARVLAGLAAVALALLAIAFVLTTTTRHHLIEQVDAQLLAAGGADRFGPDDRRPPPHDPDPDIDADADANADRPERLSAMFEGSVRTDGSLEVFFEPNLPGQQFSNPRLTAANLGATSEPFTTGSEQGEVRYRVLASSSPDGMFVRALPLADVDDTVSQLVLYQGVGLAAVLVVLGAVGWWVIHLGVRPIKQMTRTASAIAAGDLSVRVPPATAAGTESGDLALALNRMLTRIESALEDQARSEQRLRRFVADASHELRTPVTTIQGYAELYRHGGLADAVELDDAMRRTEQEARRMGRLVADMLALAKLDEQRPIEQVPVDVTALMADAAADARATAPERPVSSSVQDGLVVVGDEDRLRQVLANVVGNALAHTPAGTAVRLTARRTGGEIVLTVSDEGPGMPAEVAARVTERFYRGDPSRSRERGGSGLGMAIADAVVDAHHGTLTVESNVGVGTTVRVSLPSAP